jgi:hypothetical protein
MEKETLFEKIGKGTAIGITILALAFGIPNSGKAYEKLYVPHQEQTAKTQTQKTQGKNALWIVSDEFKRNFKNQKYACPDNTKVIEREPAEMADERFNAEMNLEFQWNKANDIDRKVLEKIDCRKDNIEAYSFSDANDIIKILKEYKGKPLDKLVIHCHGYNDGLGQKQPVHSFIYIEDLIKQNLTPEQFKNVMKKNGKGQVFLDACSTNEDYQTQFTIAEYISYLLQAPVTGAKCIVNSIGIGLGSPTWINKKKAGFEKPTNQTGAPFVTVYPEKNLEKTMLEINEIKFRPPYFIASGCKGAEYASIKELEEKLQPYFNDDTGKGCVYSILFEDRTYGPAEFRKYLEVRKSLEKYKTGSETDTNKTNKPK